MADVFRKAKLGYEDIHFDTQGSGATAQTLRSDGTYRTVQKLNASLVPITTTARAKKQASGAAVGTTDVDGTLIQVLDDLEDLGQPDGTTIENSSGTLRIKDLGVSAAKLASDAVTTAKILADNVTNAKLAANAVAGSASGATGDNVIEALSIDSADIASNAITTAKILDDAVTTAKILDSTIVNGNIANTTIKAAKMYDTPSHYIKLAGTATITGGAVSEVVAIAGVLATDVVQATTKSTTTTVTYCGKAVPASNQITFYFYDQAGAKDPGASEVFYTVLRAVSA